MERYIEFSPDNGHWAADSISESIERLNHRDPIELLAELNDSIQISPEGLRYSILGHAENGGDLAGGSTDTAIVISSAHAHDLSPHKLLQSRLIYDAAREAGITDSQGNHLPVVTFAAPTRKHHPPLEQMAQGGTEAVADVQLRILARDLGYHRLISFGYSGGGNTAMEQARKARMREVDMLHASVSDPTNAKERNRGKLFWALTRISMKDVLGAMDESDFHMYKDFFTGDIDAITDGDSLSGMLAYVSELAARPNRLYVARSLGEASLADQVNEARIGGSSVHVGYGVDSAITPPRLLLPHLRHNVDHSDTLPALTVVGYPDQNHSWGDNSELLVGHYLELMPASVRN